MNNNYTDTYNFLVYPHYVGASKQMQLYHLGACILDAAGLSARERGFGMDSMHAIHRAWVVSRMIIEVDEYPHEYETIAISTWVSKIGHGSSTRLFTVTDSQGRVICRASTIWSIIDIDTRQLVDLMQATNFSKFVDKTHTIDIGIPRRIEIPQDAVHASTARHAVLHSDIDMNRHVNSMKYLQWCIDSLPYTWLCNNDIRRCAINFTHEVRPGQSVEIHHYTPTANETTGITTNTFDINLEDIQCCRIQLTSNPKQQDTQTTNL